VDRSLIENKRIRELSLKHPIYAYLSLSSQLFYHKDLIFFLAKVNYKSALKSLLIEMEPNLYIYFYFKSINQKLPSFYERTEFLLLERLIYGKSN